MRNRTNLLVIDIESTCWQRDVPHGQRSEIIEIGIVKIPWKDTDWSWRTATAQSIVVRPQHSYVSPFCTELTGWTQEAVDLGITYPEAVVRLKKEFASKNSLWASWGKYDDKMFQSMSKLHATAYPFNNDHLNIKALAGCYLGSVMGVSQALKHYGMEFEGEPHRGMDDAKNIARILHHLLGV